ncbi:PadR family transcriptional regulator [Deinococcus cellulosilyticus]|uniref:PadR family transcriptional regulator n=1 Tax=Deinococcus cellulosilyticus (strain DSM 18568 / NBRC 106333 / KACC 11606 / 5516J-15) TaxID=1223518 RepID=A0A511N3G8_DEIC1|nr:PadR family transcriptional regulator [Deinococcus cellulosilyticus]GEM47409.1 PadR family transcriptional regulator [Deinococcus cellulosilyticus NBRC 106333 = KACC 11606]
MALPHAILGFLSFEPLTGYDLKTQCFDQSVRYFWSADQAQIYRTLEKLQQEGHIKSDLEIQEGKPNRKVYHLTDSGREVLLKWLREPQELPVFKEPFLMQLYFSDGLTNEEILKQIRYQKQQHSERLNEYFAIRDYFEQGFEKRPQDPLKRAHQLQYLTLKFGIQLEELYLKWLQNAEQVIEGLQEE